MSQSSGDPVANLEKMQAENVRLIALLESRGIQWQLPPIQPSDSVIAVEHARMSTAEKVALFRRLFHGRTDLYPIRWENQNTGRSGYPLYCGTPNQARHPSFSR